MSLSTVRGAAPPGRHARPAVGPAARVAERYGLLSLRHPARGPGEASDGPRKQYEAVKMLFATTGKPP
jgi:hypothetical protein